MLAKYHKFDCEESNAWFHSHSDLIKECSQDAYRLNYHIMPPVGWLNDPNGLSRVNGLTNIYYQYCPYDNDGSLKTWGYITTKDYIHYTNHPIVLYPDTDADAHGVYSGSAFVEDGVIHYFYTGNVKYFDRDDYDYINSGRGANVIHVTSKDGFHMSQKEVVLTNADYPQDMSNHVRDPKIFKHEGTYYMVLGARDLDGKGLVLMYSSSDLNTWSYYARITTKEKFGYMWECPDMFYLDGHWVLLTCPQGVETDGYEYANVHQTTAMILDCDFEKKEFVVQSIQQLDRGFDFYAQQTFLDDQNRRLLIGWLGIPEADYTNATTTWQHALTMVRQLHIVDDRLVQMPIEEYDLLRKDTYTKTNCYVADICVKEDHWHAILAQGVSLSYCDHVLALDVTTSGCGRTTRFVKVDKLDSVIVYMDTSALEIYVNHGQEVFTSRYYAKDIVGFSGNAKIYDMDSIKVDGKLYE